jgi:lipid-binding SYLF domain-containing protein
MKRLPRYLITALTITAIVVWVFTPRMGFAASAPAAKIDRDATKALAELYAKVPKAKELGKKAKGILIFPAIVKAGLIVGAQYGDGVLRRNGKTVSYHNTVSVSYGFQAGIQKFAYAMFFMSEPALKYLNKSGGWEVGTAPNITIVDKGLAGGFSTSTLQNAIYVFYFSQKGLMGGLGLQATKITKIDPK